MEIESNNLISRLLSSPWVASAHSLEQVSSHPRMQVEINLTPTGHDYLRDVGQDTFLRELRKDYCTEVEAYTILEFCPANSTCEIISIFNGSGTYPRLLSNLVGPNGCRMLVLVNEEMDWFNGHFPGSPVLPGVVQLHWAVRVACSLFDIELPLGSVDRLKFQNVVVPPRVVELKLEKRDKNRVAFGFSSLGVKHSSGVLRFDRSVSC